MTVRAAGDKAGRRGVLRSLGAGALVTLALAAVVASAHASLVRALSLADLVARADHIVLARAEEEQARRHPDGRMIVSDVSLRIEDVLKGDAKAGETRIVTRLGGSLPDIDLAMQVPGEARFALGERAVVFLYVAEPYGELHVVGMAQGVLPIEQQAAQIMVLPGGAGSALVERDENGKLVDAKGALTEPEPLAALLAHIRSLVAAGAAAAP